MILNYKNANIFYTDQGKGTAIILIHGFLENASMWDKITPELIKRNRVITLDLLGHGQSDCLGYIHSMELFSETINFVLKNLKIRKYILVGHSLGGYISLSISKINSNNIKGLCLLNSTSYKDSEERKKIRIRANKLVQNNFENMVNMSVSNLFYQKNSAKFKEEISKVKTEALKTSLQGYIAAQEGMKNRPDSTFFLKNSTFKKLLIIGEKDPVLNYQNSIKEAKETNSDFVVLPCGHMTHIENKDELITILKDFVKKC
ncbi:alpha/beta fold hydrolase [Polaribacter sp. Asnod1-A03]|uniref:alpha/beta fold hydrolase n=1 Tax=Polaribacter sp. Asnod1-A03 TaxID=3160581 RepID=UPI00386C3306